MIERREATRRCRARQRASGLTFHELWLRVGGERATLVIVLRSEVARGRLDFHSTSRRFTMNGGIPDDVRRALLTLTSW